MSINPYIICVNTLGPRNAENMLPEMQQETPMSGRLLIIREGPLLAHVWVSEMRNLRCQLLADCCAWFDDSEYDPSRRVPMMKIATTHTDIEKLINSAETSNSAFHAYIQPIMKRETNQNLVLQCVESRDVMVEFKVPFDMLFSPEHEKLIEMVKEYCSSIEKPLITIKATELYDTTIYAMKESPDSDDSSMHTELTEKFAKIYADHGFSKLNKEWEETQFTEVDAYSNIEGVTLYECYLDYPGVPLQCFPDMYSKDGLIEVREPNPMALLELDAHTGKPYSEEPEGCYRQVDSDTGNFVSGYQYIDHVDLIFERVQVNTRHRPACRGRGRADRY